MSPLLILQQYQHWPKVPSARKLAKCFAFVSLIFLSAFNCYRDSVEMLRTQFVCKVLDQFHHHHHPHLYPHFDHHFHLDHDDDDDVHAAMQAAAPK